RIQALAGNWSCCIIRAEVHRNGGRYVEESDENVRPVRWRASHSRKGGAKSRNSVVLEAVFIRQAGQRIGPVLHDVENELIIDARGVCSIYPNAGQNIF